MRTYMIHIIAQGCCFALRQLHLHLISISFLPDPFELIEIFNQSGRPDIEVLHVNGTCGLVGKSKLTSKSSCTPCTSSEAFVLIL